MAVVIPPVFRSPRLVIVRPLNHPGAGAHPQDRQLEIEMVSVVVSIQTRKMLAETRRIFVNARKAEQDVRKGGLVRTSEPISCSYEAA